MRARYSAFALGDAEFLWRTLHEEHEDRARPRDEVLRSLRGARDRLRYERLVILDARRRGREAEVLFCAGLSERGRDASFVELSDFEHDGEGWRYRSGIALPLAELGRPIDGLRIDELLALVAGR
jgi:SEC-C motif-containing protein